VASLLPLLRENLGRVPRNILKVQDEMNRSRYTYTTAIVIIPPDHCWEPIQTIRREHDEKVPRWMPHITMIYPFWPRNRFEEAAEKLLEVCGQIEPFELILSRFDTFHHGRSKYTMWLDPEPGDKLKKLHELLMRALEIPWGTGPFRLPFRPHLSVGQIRGHAERNQLLAELSAKWVPLRFRVEELALIWREEPPDDVFRVASTVKLGQS
jgi:2'-5' RNA ligase